MLPNWLRRLMRLPTRPWSPAAPAPDPLAQVAPGQVWLVVGLGNPGPRYAATRHNVGFHVVEVLAARTGAAWVAAPEGSRAEVAVAPGPSGTIVVARPQTFMNASGEAVAALRERLALPLDRLLVVFDDMDLPPGALRLRERGSAGTHNGMRSIVAALGSQAFPRLRVGVGQAPRGNGRDYVLAPFEREEMAPVDAAVQRAADAVLVWVAEGAAAAMNHFNG